MFDSQMRHYIVGLVFLLAPLILVIALLSIPPGVAAAEQVILDWQTDVDGNPLLPGQVIDDEFHSATGISITIKAQSAAPDGSDVRAIFPSHDPPVSPSGRTIDPDLGTPNETCPGGGPGIGEGGEVGQPGENCTPQHNILIIPTVGDSDGDGFIDGLPDDDARGGLGTFLFSEPVVVDYLEIIDQDDGETALIQAYSDVSGDPGSLIKEVSTLPLGDNSFQRIDLEALGVVRLDVNYEGSGGLANLAYTPGEPTAVNLSTFDASMPFSLFAPFLAAFALLSVLSAAWMLQSRRA
ncbi:MAG TPA: hypothetical protein VK879_11630 [Candidatus Sulfomarinibacteraceae bacterium]|nr:hypothetical protein [Candidatus Sulfomarinibacteraceae bacterium]